MSTVAIIGAGNIGGACAHLLATSDRVREIVLIDPSGNAAAGKALDIRQAGPIDRCHTRLVGTDDVSRASGCAVWVIADRFAAAPAEWQGDQALALVTSAAAGAPDAPMVFAGVEQAGAMAAIHREAHLPSHRLIGSAPEALRSAVAAIVGMEAGCSAADVSLAVLGAPARFVVPWSHVSVGGFALDSVVSQAQMARIEARTARLWPPGPYALGAAAAHVVVGILDSSRRPFCVLTCLDGEFGVRRQVGAVPVLLAPRGVAQTRVPLLSPRERVLVDSALAR